jgi:hypothetical protein
VATPTQSQTPSPPQTLPPTSSPTASKSPYPTYGETVSSRIPLDIFPASDGCNFNIVGEIDGTNISSTVGDTGYRTFVSIDGIPVQIVGCQNVTYSETTISTTLTKGTENVSITFQVDNFGSWYRSITLVLGAHFAVGNDTHPGVFGNSWSAFNVSSKELQFMWASISDVNPSYWIGPLYPSLGTVDDPMPSSLSYDWDRTLFLDTAARLTWSLFMYPQTLTTITITVALSSIRPTPVIRDVSYNSLVIQGASPYVSFDAVGPPDGSFLVSVMAVPSGEYIGGTWIYCYPSGCSGGVYFGVPQNWASGTYSFRLAVFDYYGPGGTSVSPETYQIEMLTSYVAPTASRSRTSAPTTPVRSPVRTAPVTLTPARTPFSSVPLTRTKTPPTTAPLTPAKTPTSTVASTPTPTETVAATRAVTPTPLATPTSTVQATLTPVAYTSHFTRKKTRVRKIFEFSYLIPVIVNR